MQFRNIRNFVLELCAVAGTETYALILEIFGKIKTQDSSHSCFFNFSHLSLQERRAFLRKQQPYTSYHT